MVVGHSAYRKGVIWRVSLGLRREAKRQAVFVIGCLQFPKVHGETFLLVRMCALFRAHVVRRFLALRLSSFGGPRCFLTTGWLRHLRQVLCLADLQGFGCKPCMSAWPRPKLALWNLGQGGQKEGREGRNGLVGDIFGTSSRFCSP